MKKIGDNNCLIRYVLSRDLIEGHEMIKRFLIGILLTLVILVGGMYYLMERSFEKEPPKVTINEVIVKIIEPQKVRIWSEFSGRLQAVNAVEIRPEVSGKITKVGFEDGGPVQEGDILFVIDPRPYEAAVARAEAKLVTAISNADFAKVEMERATNMIKTKAIAERIYDERANSNQTALASIKSAKAELKQANVDLEHAYVRAPISGRAGRVELTLGNLVQAGPNAPLMTRIISSDPIYADFEVDEQTYVQNVRNVANNRHLEQRIPVEITIQGTVYQGTIYSFDNRLDTASGTIRARAKFDNPDGVLVPGMFVTVKLANGSEQNVLLIPQEAISSDQSKKYVYIVGKDNKVEYRQIELGKEIDSHRIVLKGLNPGDRVIIKGIQHVKPGEIVKVQESDDR